ncbi:LOW QUALITY PROTEIN: gasdermin-B [Sturnira hondurensis]|uniref:LOW QUALITY PROTEIN: gasdermin-B n=1 Tax=Sturnira hondurensis TaxID=192404 RepID=UPI00187A4D2E|nr:LOW QUALITY PROTEIN: gasdermin-B [Sturnira hondurensis]
MPSVFETITKAVVHEMDAGGDMIEVRSIVDADRFRCLCLVRGKGGLFRRRYRSTDLTLEDILETEDGEEGFHMLDSGLPGQKAESQVVDVVDCAGTLTVKLPKQITIEGGFHGSHEQSITMLGSRIPQEYLQFLENRKLKRKLPALFLSAQTRREDLYLVTETLQTAREETLKSTRQYMFLSQLDFCGLKCERKVRVLGNRDWGESQPGPTCCRPEECRTRRQALALPPGLPEQTCLLLGLLRLLFLLKKHQRTVTIPPNLVLGYRVKQLVFPSSERMNICFSGKTKSFPEEEDGDSSCLGKPLSLEEFRNMEEKVQDSVGSLQGLTGKEREDVLSCLAKCLTSDEELQALDERVSEVLVSEEPQMEGPADPLISSLFNAAGILVEARTEAILDFLDALKELSEEKELVAETLKKGTLPLLKDQVREPGLRARLGVEVNNCSQGAQKSQDSGSSDFIVLSAHVQPAGLYTSHSVERLLRSAGVKSVLEQERGEQPQDEGCDPEAQTICALYLVVSILLQLSEGPAPASSSC